MTQHFDAKMLKCLKFQICVKVFAVTFELMHISWQRTEFLGILFKKNTNFVYKEILIADHSKTSFLLRIEFSLVFFITVYIQCRIYDNVYVLKEVVI